MGGADFLSGKAEADESLANCRIVPSRKVSSAACPATR